MYLSLFPATNIPEDMYLVFKFTELNFQSYIWKILMNENWLNSGHIRIKKLNSLVKHAGYS